MIKLRGTNQHKVEFTAQIALSANSANNQRDRGCANACPRSSSAAFLHRRLELVDLRPELQLVRNGRLGRTLCSLLNAVIDLHLLLMLHLLPFLGELLFVLALRKLHVIIQGFFLWCHILHLDRLNSFL